MPLDDTTPHAFADLPNREHAAHLLEGFTDADFPTPTGYNVLVLQYARPERTVGGIILSEITKKEDEFDGKVGLVLRVGVDAYNDAGKFSNGPWAQPGDWVLYRPMSASPSRFAITNKDRKRAVFTILTDDAFLAVTPNPERLA